MRNGFARLKEAFPNEYAYISSCLANAIRRDNTDALNHIVARYFSDPGTVGLLNDAIIDGATPTDFAISQGKVDAANYLKSVGGIQGAQESPSNRPEAEKMKQEITKNIERLELLEEKFGIALSGIYASCELYTDGEWGVEVNFDIASLNGDALARSFYICASAYNSAGQLLKIQKIHIDKESFMGFAPIDFAFLTDQMPEKVRLFPTV